MISAEEARKIDPMVRGYGKEFIWSPTTAVVDSAALTREIAKDLDTEVVRGIGFKSIRASGNTQTVTCSDGSEIECKFIINAAG